MRADELKGRAVVTLADATRIGRVDDVLFDADYRTVLGFRVKAGGLLSHAEALPRTGVRSVGADAITVADRSAVNDEERFAELAGALTLDSAQHMKVVTEGGDLLGTVNAVELDDTAEHVLGYTLDAPLLDRLRGRAPEIHAEDVARFGAGGIMIVPNAVGEQLHQSEA